jgi:hypothetical protein
LDKFNINRRLDVNPYFVEKSGRKCADDTETGLKGTQGLDLPEHFCLVGYDAV